MCGGQATLGSPGGRAVPCSPKPLLSKLSCPTGTTHSMMIILKRLIKGKIFMMLKGMHEEGLA